MKKLFNKLLSKRVQCSIVLITLIISVLNLIQLKYNSFKEITFIVDFAIIFIMFLIIFIFDIVIYKKSFVSKNVRFTSLRALFLALIPSMILIKTNKNSFEFYFFLVFSSVFFGIAIFSWIAHLINKVKQKTLNYMVPNSNFQLNKYADKNFWRKELFLVYAIILIGLLELIISFDHNLFNYVSIIITFLSLFIVLFVLLVLFIFSKYFKIIKNYWKKKPILNLNNKL